jgi:TonB family protein
MDSESGRVIIAGRVALIDSGLVLVDSTLSDSSGAFYLDAPHPGIYALLVRLEGSDPQLSSPFHLIAGEFRQQTLSIRVVDTGQVAHPEQSAQALPNNPGPRYPPELATEHVGGHVMVDMVIDTTGNADVSTIHIRSSTDQAFTDAVREVIPRMKFSPARLHGRPVPQRVVMPFDFAVVLGMPTTTFGPTPGRPPEG